MKIFFAALAALAMRLAPFPTRGRAAALEVGYFPNVTHAHALIAQNMAAGEHGGLLLGVPIEIDARHLDRYLLSVNMLRKRLLAFSRVLWSTSSKA